MSFTSDFGIAIKSLKQNFQRPPRRKSKLINNKRKIHQSKKPAHNLRKVDRYIKIVIFFSKY